MQKLVPSNPNLGRKQGNFLFVEIRMPPLKKMCTQNVHIWSYFNLLLT